MSAHLTSPTVKTGLRIQIKLVLLCFSFFAYSESAHGIDLLGSSDRTSQLNASPEIESSNAEAKVRVQGLDIYGAKTFEHDVPVYPGFTRALVDRGIFVRPEGGYLENPPVVFIVSSNVNVVLEGVYKNHEVSANFGSDRGVGFESSHRLGIRQINCNDENFALVCQTPIQFNGWNAAVPWENVVPWE